MNYLLKDVLSRAFLSEGFVSVVIYNTAYLTVLVKKVLYNLKAYELSFGRSSQQQPVMLLLFPFYSYSNKPHLF